MADLNRVSLIGRLGADPEIKSFQNGGRICNLRVATSETWKDKATGEKKEKTEWHSVSLQTEGLVSLAERFMRKGSRIFIEGKLQTRKWQDQNGNDRYTTEIVLRAYAGNVILLDGPNQGQRSGDSGQSGNRSNTGGGGQWGGGHQTDRPAGSGGGTSGGFGGGRGGFADDLDDDIPF